MLYVDEIFEDYSIRKELVSEPEFIEDIEMSEHDSAFLCGLIKKVHPRKILEIGVAGGGTTAIILKCLETIDEPYEMYSVDINSFYYRKPEKNCGYVAEKTIENIKHGTHTFLFGYGISHHLETIGKDIDFVILDTTHVLPGEILDFLIIYPYLTKNAVVCLHDIALMQYKNTAEQSYCTALLLSAVSGKKMINLSSFGDEEPYYPNIGAFQLTDETRKNMENLFMALFLRWGYLPSEIEMNKYRECIYRNYNKQLCMLFEKAVKMNVKNLIRSKFKELSSLPSNSRVVLYGVGCVGKCVLGLIKYLKNIEFVGCVDKNYKSIGEVDGIEVKSPEGLDVKSFDYLIVATKKKELVDEIVDYLKKFNMPKERIKIVP